MKKCWLIFLVVLVYVLHQDLWNWRAADPMIFGFLPIGLAYHAAYSIAAAVLMALLARFAWPKNLEEHEMDAPKGPAPEA